MINEDVHAFGNRTSFSENPLIFCGSANHNLAGEVAQILQLKLGGSSVERFPDGEIHVRIDESVRGRDTYIIQSTCPPVNENLMELCIFLDTLRRASAARVTAIIPYYGYSRQDRKVVGREPITAKLVANLLEAAGASRVLCVDLHSPALQGFFEIGMDHLTASQSLANHLRQRDLSQSIIVSPDTGGVKRADVFSKILGLPLAILHKRRESGDTVNVRAVIGDVSGKKPIIVDDIISTGSTIREATDELVRAGAEPDISIVATHPIFVGKVTEKLDHPAIKRIIVTDSVPLRSDVTKKLRNIEVVSLAPLLADAVTRIHTGQSLSEMFLSQDNHGVSVRWSV